MTYDPSMDDATALRKFLLELLIEVPAELLNTPEGRAQAMATYEAQAQRAHPAVAAVLREAAGVVRRGDG
ncbi:hypothetical protein PE067_16075 [Paracoccus sp. DMF-8]|uniref:hypothetical protein n=1 Tax=Paracoccus sp. DMF-8 TaxID=3019445 RepID=UPI0023E7C261|nr:hypothetical protein [Paracoccus sp. DMF-8]MDF3606299.1 hypothetical protein [Paracoccus sp. DMF-8]MDF3607525.1 hypothetical protein [Paracoccus sp. DMF-8]